MLGIIGQEVNEILFSNDLKIKKAATLTAFHFSTTKDLLFSAIRIVQLFIPAVPAIVLEID